MAQYYYQTIFKCNFEIKKSSNCSRITGNYMSWRTELWVSAKLFVEFKCQFIFFIIPTISSKAIRNMDSWTMSNSFIREIRAEVFVVKPSDTTTSAFTKGTKVGFVTKITWFQFSLVHSSFLPHSTFFFLYCPSRKAL